MRTTGLFEHYRNGKTYEALGLATEPNYKSQLVIYKDDSGFMYYRTPDEFAAKFKYVGPVEMPYGHARDCDCWSCKRQRTWDTEDEVTNQ